MSAPERFLSGDWFEGMFPLSSLRVLESEGLEVTIHNEDLSCLITCVVGEFNLEECLLHGSAKLSNKPIRDCKVFVEPFDPEKYVVDNTDNIFEVTGKVRSVVVKYMRALVNKDAYHIIDNQYFNQSNLYDGDKFVGLRE